MNILVINGPNLNMLGIREPGIYGKGTYGDLCRRIEAHAAAIGANVELYQSNHEGDLVDKIQQALGAADGIVINPGAYTHTSVALLDALKAVGLPAVEVHISRVEEREAFRQISYVRDACLKTITGHGFDGYTEAVSFLAAILRAPGRTVCIKPGKASGTVTAPPAKSMAHRLLIAAFLAEECGGGKCRIGNLAPSDDILATEGCIEAAKKYLRGDTDSLTMNAGESGSTLRFLIPWALTLSDKVVFTGSERLLERPLSVYEDICAEKGFLFEKGPRSLTLRGSLGPGTYRMRGDVSSQFASGLLFALPLLDGDSRIEFTTPPESLPYIRMTLQALDMFGVRAALEEGGVTVPGRQKYIPRDADAEGDWSNAAFLKALDLFGGSVRVEGLDPDSLQGDKVCVEYFRRLADGGAELDISQCPDLGPVLFAAAAGLTGGRFTGTKRLSIKESDRTRAMAEELAKFGIRCLEEDNAFTVFPGSLTAPAEPLCGHNDHRIVMALSVLLTVTGGAVSGAGAVKKSWPDFFDALKQLGVRWYAVDK